MSIYIKLRVVIKLFIQVIVHTINTCFLKLLKIKMFKIGYIDNDFHLHFGVILLAYLALSRQENGFKMTLNTHPTHHVIHEFDVGTPVWWQRIQSLGTPLCTPKNGQLRCTFLWQKSTSANKVLIDIYSQTPSIEQCWNTFSALEHTDVLFFEIDLPLGWSGHYVVVTPHQSAPMSVNATVRRQWWTTQLQQHSQIDPNNPNTPYRAHIARWVNQLQYLGRPNLKAKSTAKPSIQQMVKCYSVDLTPPQHKN